MNDLGVPEQDAEEMVAQLNALVEVLENYPDSAIRETALDVVQITLQLYGETLRRILESIGTLAQKEEILARLFSDEVIRSMLLIHDLLPISLQDRVAAALNRLRPFLLSQGADVELVSVEGERARLRLIRSGKGAPQIAMLEQEIRKALTEAAPDLIGVEIEGLAEQLEATAKAASFLKSLISPARTEEAPAAKLVQLKKTPVDKTKVEGHWVAVIRANGLTEGQFRIVHFGEDNLLVCKINSEIYAYRNACAEGGAPLDDAMFESPMLTCLCHGYRFDLRHKGKCMEKPNLSLASLPAIIEDEKIKVAL
jgi:nitrite reductase/ring-hydroxylating ferredoxin subunit